MSDKKGGSGNRLALILLLLVLLGIPAGIWIWSSRFSKTPELDSSNSSANRKNGQTETKPFQEFADTDAQEETETEVFEVLESLNEPERPKKKGPPTAAEMPFATPVPGNPLVVVLPGANASLGQISVEKYSNDGTPTGQPLKRGTQVQIPDPNNPGEKIYFKVP